MVKQEHGSADGPSPNTPTVDAEPSQPIREVYGWSRYRVGDCIIRVRGHAHNCSLEDIARCAARVPTLSVDDTAAWLDGINGHFSIVARGPDWTFAASDPVRAYPLIWATMPSGETLVGATSADVFQDLALSPVDVDADMASAVAQSGFTIGERSLYTKVKQLGPGTFLISRANTVPAITRYHQWTPWRPDDGVDTPALAADLARVNERVIDDLVRSGNGRPILVPLSAGLDSRFIASGLVEAGYANVTTFSYGLAGNREADTACEIAQRLGLPWSFVRFNNRALARTFASPDYQAFADYSDSLTAVHFPQDYHALMELRSEGAISEDTIVVNGQSGDFISGNHIPKSLAEARPDLPADARRSRVIDALMAKHFRLWQSISTKDVLSTIRALLDAEIDALGGMPVDAAGDHGIYEFCEFQDRQSKYVINGQRLYEHFGLEWRLPLWERAYLDFWARAPLQAKAGQKLYRGVLHSQNWGKVWRDIPVNPTRIRPGWIRPVRFAAKVAFAPIGRTAWHRFEKRYLDYFMANTSAYAAFPYRRVAADRRGHHSPISWHTEAYLARHGLDYAGQPPR